jgi:hypothetical protein
MRFCSGGCRQSAFRAKKWAARYEGPGPLRPVQNNAVASTGCSGHLRDRAIATVPCSPDKLPLVKRPHLFGRPASREIARKFPDAQALGFFAGARNKITVLDIDTTDERVMADALTRHGQTPLISRTASGKFHLVYRHNGERRRIRPWRGRPIDLLGGGLCIVPPSIGSNGNAYQIIAGSLDDLDRLPVIGGLDPEFYRDKTPTPRAALPSDAVPAGQRNNALFDHCMRQAHYSDDFDAVLDVARTFNMQNCIPPLPDNEVMQVAQNAWRYTASGQNRYGKRGVWLPEQEAVSLARNHHDALILLTFLRAKNGPDAEFMVANGLEATLGLPRKRLAAARQRLIELGYITQVRKASFRTPGLFHWTLRSFRKRGGRDRGGC